MYVLHAFDDDFATEAYLRREDGYIVERVEAIRADDLDKDVVILYGSFKELLELGIDMLDRKAGHQYEIVEAYDYSEDGYEVSCYVSTEEIANAN